MRLTFLRALTIIAVAAFAETAIGQEAQTGDQSGAQPQVTYQNMTPDQRAAATRAFLGLGPEPDKAAAARGAPLFQRSCAFCHGPQGRGATGASLITSDVVLGDDHGERLLPFLKKGVPEKGMPAFATFSDNDLKDISEFIHLQVEEVANRGAYHVLNIVVGNAEKGHAYTTAHCMTCHTTATFEHIASRYHSSEQLQRGWIWPSRATGSSDLSAISATAKMPDGSVVSGHVTQISDFRITLLDAGGKTNVIDRRAGVEVHMKDPLAAHEEMIPALSNDDMHNVTAYLDSLK